MSTSDLQQKIRSIRDTERSIRADDAWILRTRETLLMQVQNSLPIRAAARESLIGAVVRSFIPARLITALRGPVLAALSIVGLVTGGSVASVLAAENAIPGDSLYSLKLATEQTRLAFTRGRTDKLVLKTTFVDRRVEEMRTIVSSDVSEKPARIQKAAEILKRDLDTVNVQLNEVSQSESAHQTVQAARLIDQKSTKLVTTLKDVRATVPQDVRAKVTEAEVAAVGTGVKAVQVLIDSQSKPETAGVVTHEELVLSINAKVQGLEENIADASHKITIANSAASAAASTTNIGASTSTAELLNASVSSTAAFSLTQIVNAKESLSQAKQLLEEQKLGEVSTKLVETLKVVGTVETTANAATDAMIIAASSTLALPTGGTSTGTTSGSGSTVPSAPIISGTASSSGAVSMTSTIIVVPSSTGSVEKPK